MKKIILIYLSIPIITLTANASNFYERTGDLRTSGGTHNSSNYYSQSRVPIKYESKLKYRQYQNNRVQARTYNHNQRPQRNIRIPAAASRKFFYAQRAAKNGIAKAQFDLAIMYANGRGVQKSEKKAFNWFHKAAKNNHAVAKYYMGISFLQGRGVKKQFHLAKYWFKLAKKQGYKPSINYLNKLKNI